MKPVIFFDWDGTLCDSMQLCIEENRNTLRLLCLPDQPDEVLRRCNGPTFEEAAPIIGIPLPFISYGGSFMFSTLALTGLCQSVHIRRHEHTLYS
jgi:phosphoglycolate phosphatase-like HAD superfamily hydrolase